MQNKISAEYYFKIKDIPKYLLVNFVLNLYRISNHCLNFTNPILLV